MINDRLHVDEKKLLMEWLNKWGLQLAGKLAVEPE
jgi:hypothetical protein